MRLHSGFTLIELAVAMAVTAVLAALAYPSFLEPLVRARRTDGIAALMHLQLQQEHWRSGHGRYASQAELNAAPASPLAHYTLQVSNATSTGYELVATATGAQAVDRPCRVLRLVVADGSTSHGGGPDATAAHDSTGSKRCWNR
jgi:type IV pilus assembly protein PilE